MCFDLTFVFPCIASTIKIDNEQDAAILIYLLLSALHVSGDVFAHHQEHITVTTASGNVHQCCCWLVFRSGWNPKRNTQQHRWTLPEAVVTVICS